MSRSYSGDDASRQLASLREQLENAGEAIQKSEQQNGGLTARGAAETALRQSAPRLRAIAEQMPCVLWTTDSDLRFTSSYGAGLKDLGLTPGQVVGMGLDQFFAGQEEKETQLERHRRACAGETVVYETTVYGRAYSSYLEPLRNPSGEIIGVLGMALDITLRRQTEAALRASEEKYHRFFEENLAGYYRMSAAGKLLECNPAFARMFGFRFREEALERDLALLYPKPQALREFIALVAGRKRLEQYSRELRGKDGRPVRVLENAIGAFDENGNLVEVRGYLIDDTERWKTDEQFRQVQKMDAVGRLAGGVAHDFNNLLTVINGYCELALKKLQPNDALHRDVGEILKAGEKAKELVRSLLAFSRQQPTEPRALDLNLVIHDSARMIERLIGEDIILQTRLQPLLPAARADAGQVNQILVNLAVNAKDAMPRGGRFAIETADVEVETGFAAAHAGLEPGKYVVLTVTDSGTGMDSQTMQHVFEPFFTTKPEGKGVGLGLSTVYGIVKQNGGWIGVRSAPGEGTTFQIYWPQAEPGLAPAAPASRVVELERGIGTILLVEDQEHVRALVRHVLSGCGYRVLAFADGPAALRFVESGPGEIDLLLTDVVMPAMSGPDLAGRLRRLRPKIPVLYMSGYNPETIARRDGREPDIAYLPKPFTAAELSAKVREALAAASPGR